MNESIVALSNVMFLRLKVILNASRDGMTVRNQVSGNTITDDMSRTPEF